MRIALIGVSHKTAPVALRERLAFPTHRVALAAAALRDLTKAQESVFLSTCNRVEVYACAPAERVAGGDLLDFFVRFHGLGHDALPFEAVYQACDEDAVKHLFRVAAGLESLALGETQIASQVREAYEAARERGDTDKILNRLFQQALHAAKRVRTETKLGRGHTSVPSLGVRLAEQVFGSLESKAVLLLGAGDMAELALKCCVERGARPVMVANRRIERARELAAQYGGRAVRFDELPDRLAESDVVVGSTAAPHFVIRRDQVAAAMRRRGGAPLFLIDIAAPRDVEPSVAQVDGVHLYNIDDLKSVVEENVSRRDAAVQDALAIGDREAQAFMRWYASAHAGPAIAELRAGAEALKRKELDRLFRKVKGLDPDARRAVAHMADRLVNRILHPQVAAVREAGRQEPRQPS